MLLALPLVALLTVGWPVVSAGDAEPPAGAALQPVVAAAMPPFDAARARALYDTRCAICHGTDGRGDGPIAGTLEPRPRDFTRGVYKFRSTPSGSLPTDRDLFDSITRGLPGTSMMGWGGLPDADRWQLVRMVEGFSPRFVSEPATEELRIDQPPPRTDEAVIRGRAVWDKVQCAKCHGDDGRGFGPAARTQRDDLGRIIYPFNLTRGGDYRAGSSAAAIYRTILGGLDGTPMPSYADSLGAAETWDLVHYVRSLHVEEARP